LAKVRCTVCFFFGLLLSVTSLLLSGISQFRDSGQLVAIKRMSKYTLLQKETHFKNAHFRGANFLAIAYPIARQCQTSSIRNEQNCATFLHTPTVLLRYIYERYIMSRLRGPFLVNLLYAFQDEWSVSSFILSVSSLLFEPALPGDAIY
jgi:hypothetical protein